MPVCNCSCKVVKTGVAMSLLDIPQELFKAVFYKNVLLVREICKNLKLKVERLDNIGLAISVVGSCEISSDFIKKFKGNKISISCKHSWKTKHRWIESVY